MELFAQLYDANFEKLFGYSIVRTRHQETTEDIIHEAFLRLCNKYGHITDETEATKLLWGIIKKIHLEYITKQVFLTKQLKAEHARSLVFEQPNPFEPDKYQQAREILQAELKKLPDKQQRIATLFYCDQKTKSQIAELLNISRDQVKTYLKRITQKLKSCICTPPTIYNQSYEKTF
jgi:RNA polymerase sigma factor (sigma-70 family)